MCTPDRITVALAADTIPASMAPPGRRIPNSTTVASHSSPVWVGYALLTIDLLKVARNTPPMPARAAELEKITSLATTGETPAVDAASSDERIAVMARPHGDLRRLVTRTISSPSTINRNTARERSSFRSIPRNDGRV